MRVLAFRVAASASLMFCAATVHAQEAGAEAATAAYLDSIRAETPLLVAFLREMPKGADLHSHLSGTVYPENFLRWAVEDGGCVIRSELRLAPGPCTDGRDTLTAATAVADAALYSALVDAMSMRNWNAARINGHDQFFSTFGRTFSTRRRTGDMLAEAASRAAAGNVSYLELMFTADGGAARALGDSVGWLGDVARTRDSLLARGIGRAVALARSRLTAVEARRDTVLSCGTPAADPGCGATVRWLYQVLRAMPPQQVFAQILTGFILAREDSRVVGFNLVQPEDDRVAMRDYSLHMRMIGALRAYYPDVKISLHAGELATGLVPPEGLRFHVREAVEIAGASRIGHGVAVMHEDRPHELLAGMARRGVLVEINLSSNDVILGVKGRDHPLRAYMAAGVPVALSTDDEGVARSEMTMEYVRAVQQQLLGYGDLKEMARASLRHAFVEEPVRRRLLTELDAASARFEARIAQRSQRR